MRSGVKKTKNEFGDERHSPPGESRNYPGLKIDGVGKSRHVSQLDTKGHPLERRGKKK